MLYITRRLFLSALSASLFMPFSMYLHCSKIAFATLAVGKEYREGVKLGLQNKQEYCAQHGYDFMCEDKNLDESRPIAWSKVLHVLELMKNSDYDWIFWSDADALIMNTGLRLEELIDQEYNFIVTNDFNGLNTGHFLIRNCEWSRRFLQEVYVREEFIHDPCWEQESILVTLQERYEYSSKTKIIPQRIMNSFANVLGVLLQGTYQPGDFILHFAGMRDPELLKDLFEQYYPLASDKLHALTYEHYLGIHDVIQCPKSIPLWNWATDAQNKQFAAELKKYPDIKTVAQVGLSNAEQSEIFLKGCPQLNLFRAYVRKRYNPFCRAACDYLSRKYHLQWQELAAEALEESSTIDTQFDLIYIRSRSFDALVQAKGLAHEKTIVWIDSYNMPTVKEMLSQAVEENIVEIIDTYSSGENEGLREWVEVRYLF